MPRVSLGIQPDRRTVEMSAELLGGLRRCGISRKDLSKRMGVSQSTISRWLRMPELTPFGELLRMADILRIPPEEMGRIFKEGKK